MITSSPRCMTDQTRLLTTLDPNEDPVTGLERIASFVSENAEIRRRNREETQRELEESRRSKSDINKGKEGAVSSRYESLNYEIIENKLYQAEEMEPGHQRKLFHQSVNRWVVCFFIGVLTAIVAAAIDITIYYSSLIKFRLIISNLLNLCEKRMEVGGGCIWTVEFAWICYNCFLITISASLVLFLSPIAAGSGISQVKCFLNGVEIPGVVRLKTLFAKAFGVACTVAGGLSAGKEGPMIHSGAVVAAGISQGKCVTFSLDFHIFEQFRNDREKRDFVSAGAAAGVAAAFGAPIGGVLFSLEEGASFWNQSLTWRMFFAALMSSFTLNCILSVFHGVGGFLSWNGLANFGVFEDHDYNIWEIPIFLIIGVLGGLSGALFNFLNLKLSRFRKKYIRSKCQKLMECLLVAAASAFTGFITLFLVNDCQPVGRDPKLTEVTKLWCRKGQYSAVANLFFQSPEESVKSLFHSPANSYAVSTLLIFAVEYYLLSLWTYGLSVPSGIFIPTLLTGAAWGRLIGVIVEYMFPDVTGIHLGKYALAGAAAQLGGVVRMTISLTAILVEATRDITFGLPIMLVLMVTKWVGDLFNEGLYDAHIELNEVPILGWCAPELSRNLLAGQNGLLSYSTSAFDWEGYRAIFEGAIHALCPVCFSFLLCRRIMRKDVVTMMPKERVSRVIEILHATSHHGFPVVDEINSPSSDEEIPEYGHLKGLILKSQLIILIKKRVFCKDSDCRVMVDGSELVQLSDFADEYPTKLQLSEGDRNCWLDLTPYMHSSPYRVPLSASLPSIFHLFRGLGLRHVAVVDDENKLRGIITRKDLARMLLLLFVCSSAFMQCVHAVGHWSISLQYSASAVDEFVPLGSITVDRAFDNNYTAHFQSSVNPSNWRNNLLEAAKNGWTYRVKAMNDNGDVQGYSEPVDGIITIRLQCLMLRANGAHHFRMLWDPDRQDLQSLAVFPENLNSVGINHFCETNDFTDDSKLRGSIVVNTVNELPLPDSVSYIRKMEKERQARQHGAQQDNRSFIQKYWMYIAAALIFMVISNATTAEQGGE
ncbi:unnamed protein product [Litomosoides sigmodontis]|uniref:Chloride channel protein n=1 Tax=Litomosoides sigmodontis TaxID=42156 RepID=A0A3P6T7H3_LITSI|nr:unnamed protein product [Litomosoides sigmodontis]